MRYKDHLKFNVLATSILITGASGLIGTRLTERLLQKGHRVAHLGRSKKSGKVPSYVWNVTRGEMDIQALDGIECIIHLAGSGVADKRWTAKGKKEILESRTQSSALLYETLKKTKHSVKAFISASAIGYYGCGLDDILLTEESEPGKDFLASVVVAWEKEVDQITSLGIRVAKIRTGIVLSERGGALKEMANPIRWGVGSPLGTGRQMLSWIHLDDLCNLFIKTVEDESMKGAYNGVSPHAVTNREITKAIAKVLKRPLWLPPVPGFILRLILGGMAEVVVNGSHVSSAKIQKAGFNFQFPELESALKDLLQK